MDTLQFLLFVLMVILGAWFCIAAFYFVAALTLYGIFCAGWRLMKAVRRVYHAKS